MSVGVTRYVEMLAERKLRPFPPVLNLRWRVSADEALRVSRVPGIGAVATGDDVVLSILGLTYFVDDALPPNSIILEPLP